MNQQSLHTQDNQALPFPNLPEPMSRLLQCAQTYTRRKGGLEHPRGKFDNAKRFYLAETFRCCASIREPSRAFPYSQNKHARSLAHVAHEFGFDGLMPELRKIVKALEQDNPEAALAIVESPLMKRRMIEHESPRVS